MGAFKIDNPLIAAMIKIANMMILSFFWLVCCLPVVTVMSATAALYHTMVKVVRKNGSGVAADFFGALRDGLRKGIPLSVLAVVFSVLLAFALRYGMQIREQSLFGAIYFAAGCVIAFFFAAATLHVPLALSRFEGGIGMYIRMGLYFAGRNLGRTLFRLVLLALVVLLTDFYPIVLLILPGLYMDLIASGVEKQFGQFMEQNGLLPDGQEEQTEPAAAAAETGGLSSLELEQRYGEGAADE